MFDISEGYAINSGRMGKRAADATEKPEDETKVLVHLRPQLVQELDKDAERCGRARMRQIEAIVAAYFGYDIEVRDMAKVRRAVSKGRGPRPTAKGAKGDSAQDDAGQKNNKK